MTTIPEAKRRLRLATKRLAASLPHRIADPDSVWILLCPMPEAWQACAWPMLRLVLINRSFADELQNGMQAMVSPMLAHELHHVHQWRNEGRLRYLFCKAFHRAGIEASADQVEKAANRLTGNAGLLSGDDL
jgi:hypothetical protein